MSDKPSILFACVHNSGRSVAAQVLARHYAGDAIDVYSAGSDPGKEVNPLVAQVLEVGEEILVEEPDAVQRRLRDRHQGADGAVDIDRRVELRPVGLDFGYPWGGGDGDHRRCNASDGAGTEARRPRSLSLP